MSSADAFCHRRDNCRLCARTALHKVLSLAPIPLANAFVTREELETTQPRFPLDVWLCEGCGHVQLLDVVDSKVLFEHYVYVSGTSPAFVRHFGEYADEVVSRFARAQNGLVVEIGSNDGTLLKFFRDRGRRILGVDPAREIGRRLPASSRGSLPMQSPPSTGTPMSWPRTTCSHISTISIRSFAASRDCSRLPACSFSRSPTSPT